MGLETLVVAGSLWLFGKYNSKFVDGLLNFLKESGLRSADLAKWAKYGWSFAPVKYDNRMRELYSTIPMLGKTKPVSLEGIFTDVYVLNELTAFRRFDISKLKEMNKDSESLGKETSRINGLELVKDSASAKDSKNNRLFILGKPGAGKTTFLKYLALQAANGVIDKVPIFVSIKEWDDSGLDLLPFIVKQFEICDFPNADLFVKYVLKHGYAIVLFDGLDEVKQEERRREKTISSLRDFSTQYWDSQCLITCRIAATEYSFEHFQYIELADFTDGQIDQYVSKWFKEEPKKLELFKEEFSKAENKGLREIARQPILLGLICIYFDEMLVFAHRRVEIYEKALEALLIKWDSSRLIRRDEIYRGLSLGRKLEMFARIAARTFQDNEYFLPQDKLARYIVEYLLQLPNAEAEIDIDGIAVLKAIEERHGIFSERANSIYSFSHLTFQEYFAAKHIASDNSGRALRNLLNKDIVTDDRWYEVIRFTASLQGNADLFFDLFKKAIGEFISSDPELDKFLRWAEVKANSVIIREEQPIARSVYCLLGIIADHALCMDANPLDLGEKSSFWVNSPAPAIISFITGKQGDQTSLTRALSSMRNSILDLDKTLHEEDDTTHPLVKQSLLTLISYVHTFLQAPVVGYDYMLDIGLLYLLNIALVLKRISHKQSLSWIAPQFKALILRVQVLSSAGKQSLLAGMLAEMAMLLDEPYKDTWIKLANDLHETMRQTRNIGHDWQLTTLQYRNIREYFKVNTLLYECLRQAVVSDRSSILNSFLVLEQSTGSIDSTVS